MDFFIFIILIAIGSTFAVFGFRSHAFAVLSGITFILLGVLTLTSNITMTYFVATVNNTTQIVNTTATLLDPPMDWITPMILIFGGVAEMGVLGFNRREGGFVHG